MLKPACAMPLGESSVIRPNYSPPWANNNLNIPILHLFGEGAPRLAPAINVVVAASDRKNFGAPRVFKLLLICCYSCCCLGAPEHGT